MESVRNESVGAMQRNASTSHRVTLYRWGLGFFAGFHLLIEELRFKSSDEIASSSAAYPIQASSARFLNEERIPIRSGDVQLYAQGSSAQSESHVIPLKPTSIRCPMLLAGFSSRPERKLRPYHVPIRAEGRKVRNRCF